MLRRQLSVRKNCLPLQNSSKIFQVYPFSLKRKSKKCMHYLSQSVKINLAWYGKAVKFGLLFANINCNEPSWYTSEMNWKYIGTSLTLKVPRKNASENVVCLCRLLNILANFSKLFFAYRQTVWTLIRLLLKEQSELGPHCLQKWLLKSQTDDKADDNSCDWRFKG